MLYELCVSRYFRENGKTYFPGQTIELDANVADEINRNEGPTLKAVRQNAQAHATAVRNEPKPKKGRKTRAAK